MMNYLAHLDNGKTQLCNYQPGHHTVRPFELIDPLADMNGCHRIVSVQCNRVFQGNSISESNSAGYANDVVGCCLQMSRIHLMNLPNAQLSLSIAKEKMLGESEIAGSVTLAIRIAREITLWFSGRVLKNSP
jgi:hypothetical protein